MPAFRVKFYGVLTGGLSGILGVILSVLIKEKKISAIIGFFLSGVLYIIAGYYEIKSEYLLFINCFFFVGIVNFVCFLSTTFQEEEKIQKFMSINNIAGIFALLPPIFVHIVYIKLSIFDNVIIIGFLCIILSLVIIFIKNK